jgi:DNA polymerase I
VSDGVLAHVNLQLVDSVDKASAFMSWLGQSRDILGVDTETSGLKCHRDRLRLVQIGDMNAGWAIPWDGWGGVALEALMKYQGEMVFHNSRFDIGFLRVNSGMQWPWHRTHDTLTMSHLTLPTLPHDLKGLGAILVDPQAAAAQRLLHEGMAANKWDWGTVPVDYAPYWVYGAMDPVITCHIHDKVRHNALTTYRYVYDLEMSIVRIIQNMEHRGARVDIEYCRNTRQYLMDYAARGRDWAREAYGIQNIGSNQKVIERFEELGFVVTRFTDSGAKSCDKYQLLLWANEGRQGSELAETILAIRSAEKSSVPYFDNFMALADHEDRLHATIWPLGTRTARMSVTEPALQTVPKKDPLVRNAFVPSEASALITCDYDQIEMRLLAHFSGDEGLTRAFFDTEASGGDFFVNLANQIYQTDNVQKKNDKRRDLTKNTAYGKAYGAGVTKMAETAGVLYDVMKDVNDRFDANFPGVKVFQNTVGQVGAQRMRAEGEPYIVTPFGRRLPADADKAYTLVNYLIQSHAAEIFKRAIVEMDAVGLGPFLVLPVHDEIVADVPEEHVEEAMHLIPSVMTDRVNYNVPITASAELITDRWGSKYAK